jgi:hypothetical protein
MAAELRGPEILSIHRSFIVRLYPGDDLEAGEISGRVEHVVSGEAGEFRSVEELLRFMAAGCAARPAGRSNRGRVGRQKSRLR